MRRLPVYLLLDTSSSMNGAPIEAVREGVKLLTATLRQDPQALEMACISVITFDSEARQVAPLTDLASFQPPDIKANGSTSMGAAMSLLAERIGDEVIKTTAEQRGDWKPLVFMMTDGSPTDNWKDGLDPLLKQPLGIFVACAVGAGADTDVLKQITKVVVQLDTADAATVSAFFKWVSASVSTTSKRVDLTKKDVTALDELPPPPPEVNLVL